MSKLVATTLIVGLVATLPSPPAIGAAASPAASPTPSSAPAKARPAPRPSALPELRLANPWLAAGLSFAGTPLVVGAGAGQIYAGDTTRGLIVGGVEPLWLAGTVLASMLVIVAVTPNFSLCSKLGGTPFACQPDPNTSLGLAFVTSWAAYGGFAAWDAFQTAKRRNAERVSLPTP